MWYSIFFRSDLNYCGNSNYGNSVHDADFPFFMINYTVFR